MLPVLFFALVIFQDFPHGHSAAYGKAAHFGNVEDIPREVAKLGFHPPNKLC
jgi:hypothetical protein